MGFHLRSADPGDLSFGSVSCTRHISDASARDVDLAPRNLSFWTGNGGTWDGLRASGLEAHLGIRIVQGNLTICRNKFLAPFGIENLEAR